MRHAVLVLALVGCGGAEGPFRSDGFYSALHPYRVLYPGADRSPLARSGWIVDNFEIEDGQIDDEKTGRRYRTRMYVDGDDDGFADDDYSVPVYDLLLRNTRHAGQIWVRTLPIPNESAGRELRSLALDFIDAVGVTGDLTADLAPHPPSARRLATRVLDGFPVTLNGTPGYEMWFEAADVDQVRFGDAGRNMRTRLIVLRPDFSFRMGGARFPSLMVIGYTNRAEDFARGHADFERLAAGVDVLSEQELIEARAAQLFTCVKPSQPELSLFIDLDSEGRVQWADTKVPRRRAFDRAEGTCAQEALRGVRLRDKGYRRRLIMSLDRGGGSPQRAAGYSRIRRLSDRPTVSAK